MLSKTFLYLENSFEIKLESLKKSDSEKQPARLSNYYSLEANDGGQASS
jgi:hypothetical protein